MGFNINSDYYWQFTAPDLAAIANGFDALERQAMGDVSLPESGGNMDDTGELHELKLELRVSSSSLSRFLLGPSHGQSIGRLGAGVCLQITFLAIQY